MKSVLWGAGAALILAATPALAELKIGYVNFQLLAQQSPQAQTIQQSLRSEFLPRQQELAKEQKALTTRADAFQRNQATMTDQQRDDEQKYLRDTDRDLQAKKSEFQDDVNQRKNEELSRLQKALIEQVQTYAKAQGFDLVLAGDVIYATPTIDLTPAILERLKGSPGSLGTTAPRARKSSGHSK
ncbi:MAG: OmpH family outer membrane protein [Steroidobacteraceae bacterium]